MLPVTLKSLLKMLYNCALDQKIVVEAESQEGKSYTFTIENNYGTKGPRKATMCVNPSDYLEDISDIEMLSVPELNIIRLSSHTFQKDGSPYQDTITHVKYPAQVFIMVCRLTKERACFRIRHEDNVFDAHYIDGKLYYHTIDEFCVNLYSTNLFSLNKEMPDYEVLYIDMLPVNITFRGINERFEQMSRTLGKRLSKFKDGIPSR